MFNYILYRIGLSLALSLPLKLCYGIAVWVSDLRLVFVPQDLKIANENLKVIFPEKSGDEIRRIARQAFRNFAKYLVDFFRYAKIDTKYIEKNIHIENIENFNRALDKNKGVIALSAHLGNWELGAVIIAVLGYPFWAVALPHKDKKVDDFFNSQRASKGVKVIPLGRAVRASINLLKENKMVALVGDRDFSEKGVVLDFFGKPTLFPEGPAAFALKTGAIIVPAFMVRNPDDTFTLRIEKPLEVKSSGNREKDITDIIAQYKLIFEGYIRKYPDQWYMFKKFWIE